MSRPRPPWWIYIVAGLFLAYYALINYCVFRGPQTLGMRTEFDSGRMVVRDPAPGWPAALAGLQDGDRVLAVGGQEIHGAADWASIFSNFEVGRPVPVRIERGGVPLDLTLRVEPRSWIRLGPLPLALRISLAAAQLVCLILAIVIVLSRPRDPVACIGASFLAAVGTVYFVPPHGLAPTWRQLPALVDALFWIPFATSLALAPLLFSFFATFPRGPLRARTTWVMAWLPWLAVAPGILLQHYRMINRPASATGTLPVWFLPAFSLVQAAYVVAGLAFLLDNYRRLEGANDRRRVRLLVFGSLVGMLAILPQAIVRSSGAVPGAMARIVLSLPAQFLATLLFLMFPLSVAYTILRHRLFDIRLMVRQGLQYALARGLLISLVPALGGVLLADLLAHRDRRLAEIFRARGWSYVVLGALALTAHSQRKRWMDALDRRFFRERYDAQRILREVVEEVRRSPNLDQVAARVVSRIEASLHAEFAALLVREPGQESYRTLAASPSGQSPPPLPAEGKLMGLIRLLGKPVEVSLTEGGWLKRQLPHEETDFLRRARIGLLVPVTSAVAPTEALIALGTKQSEEPYTAEDEDLLVAIASSLAILLERPVVVPRRVRDLFEECPQCGLCYDSDAGRCPSDGAALIVTPAPRYLSGRYRLDRRLGRGGMGTVYEAADTALERRVAVKLIRDDLGGSVEAAERFQREARVAAGFAHPHVVTVHDFGVAAGRRAFLVMEFLEGRTLRDELKARQRLAPARVTGILRGVCAAVEAAHRRDLVHRDLKPENIFLAGTETGGVAKVLDFGVAKFLPSSTQRSTVDTGSGTLVGTPRYMAPEQLRGGAVSRHWDLWALALSAYEMLTGAYAFSGATAAEWHETVLSGRFTPVATHLPGSPPIWQEFFQRSLALDPGIRPGSATAFFSDLERALT